ncbi:MAG: hypothetical protein U0270_34790 [Labilithrix sp.]
MMAAIGTMAVIVACGSDDESKFKDPDAATPSFLPVDGGLGSEAGDDPDGRLYKDDPFPNWCGIDGGAPPDIKGTPECPDDKNKPGCGCATPGQEANCWTGLRKNRNLGQCHDGKTVCKRAGENDNVWGECVGQRLPTPNATGEEACSCFSVGLWKIANTAPCVWSPDGNTYYAYSTLPPAKDGDGPGKCTKEDHLESGQKTPETWSTDTLNTDCAGTFRLCFRIRVGDYKNPSANDCVMGESCVDVNYTQENVEQKLPDLPSWNSVDSACAKKWEKDTPDDKSPGYGEMYVSGGQTVACEAVSNVPKDQEFVFNRVQYCARKCREAAHQQDADCVECQLKGQGKF